ncbi:LysR family transcriptional regulator [Pseudonocardia alaniniphila]|uniref:LysR family transcriptional regulator n=1 Tax=Pseudonocardia alaniniphila TaxID=75291 RepID=A0ABS9TN73_9PSEU|nr:LysR family transcriptional regulator [Pseudonocardia alaniniphila]MCH6169994.1 LysR family transcriptional regulator [Pseudonocardia alaniniphila]
MDRVETRELSYFVAVAEELHFGRAAERLGIAQPPLSRAISRLERRMGVQLFERTSRRVTLTAAGDVFLAESRKALHAVDTAVLRAQQSGHPDRLVLAVRAGTDTGLLADVIRAYRRQPGAAELEIVLTRDPVPAVRNGTADIGLMCSRNDLAGLETVELTEQKPVALLPAGHPLTARPAVTAADLAQEPAYRDDWPIESLDQIVDRVALGDMIVVVGAKVSDRLGPSVLAVPVVDLPPTVLVIGWSAGAASAARTAFVRTARIIAAAATLDRAS